MMDSKKIIDIYVCSSCKRFHAEKKQNCYYCNSLLVLKETAKFGTLYSFTMVPEKMDAISEDKMLVLVDMDEGIKILGELENNFSDQVLIGMKMEIVSIHEKKIIFALVNRE